MVASTSPSNPRRPQPTLPWALIVIGLLLQFASGVGFVVAQGARATEQQKRDNHWEEVQRQAASVFPHSLPGEERPEPAPLPYVPAILLLAAAGSASVALGGWRWSVASRNGLAR